MILGYLIAAVLAGAALAALALALAVAAPRARRSGDAPPSVEAPRAASTANAREQV